jgi:hypothetical protein
MNDCMVSLTAKFSWIEILKISSAKFAKYKKEGVPSKEQDFSSWDKYIEELEEKSNQWGFTEYSENIEVIISGSDKSIIERKLLNAENFRSLERPLKHEYEKGKNYLVRIKSIPLIFYSDFSGIFDYNKFHFILMPTGLPGGKFIKGMSAKYDDNFLTAPMKHTLYKETIVYLADSKGNKFNIDNHMNSD